jgi:YHS domain-containing protein
MFARLLLCVFLFLPLTASAADVKPYPLATCIVSGDKIDPAVPAVVYNGQQVKFCCKACVKKFQANPEKYLIKLPK